MNKEILSLSSKLIEISEHDNYKEATFLISVLDEYNLNNVLIAKEEGEKYHKTILGYPIVAYLKYDSLGKPSDFGGHELRAKLNPETQQVEYYFATFPIGSVTESWIEDRQVQGYDGEKSCILIKTKLWSSRYPNYFEVFDKLWESSKLSSSWEISVSESKKTDKGKQLLDFEFIGNCVLGSAVQGAVKGAGVLEVAETENESNNELSNALLQDLKVIELLEKLKTSSIEDVQDNKINKGGKDNMAKKKFESSSLTINDLYQKIAEQLNPKGWSSNPYYSIWEIYPEEHKILCKDIEESDDNLTLFTYSIDTEDNVTLGEGTPKKLSTLLSELMNVNISMNLDDTAKLLSEKETKIVSLEKEISEKDQTLEKLSNELSQKVETINKLGDEVDQIKQEVSELKPFKEEHDKIVAEKESQELAEKKENLKQYATKGGYITEEEIETSEEIKSMIENLDETAIKLLRAERIEKKIEEVSSNKEEKKLETSSVENKDNVKVNLDNGEENDISSLQAIKLFLKK